MRLAHGSLNAFSISACQALLGAQFSLTLPSWKMADANKLYAEFPEYRFVDNVDRRDKYRIYTI